MMRGAEHYLKAERQLDRADLSFLTDGDLLVLAQVHATLALAVAVATVAESLGITIHGYGDQP